LGKFKRILIFLNTNRSEYPLYQNIKNFSSYITLSLHSVDVIMTPSKMPFFTVSDVKKANNVLANNYNKFKHMFTSSGRQHLKSKVYR